MPPSRSTELPGWLWLWLPVLIVCALILINLVDPAFYRAWLESERGFVELATPVVLVPGIIFGAQSLWLGRSRITPPVYLWTGAMVLASVYFAGEELSWGQQLFGWATPEHVQLINDQQETNIHNISSWFDQKPRLLLEIWVLVGGIILPISRWINGIEYVPDQRRYWFWPGTVCFPSAVIAILIKLPERIKDVFGLEPYSFELRWSEVQELYFAAFLCLYLVSIRQRLISTVPQVSRK